jgi:hypothetical protein
MDSDFIPISHYEVNAAITKLNNKKSDDEFGISANLKSLYIVRLDQL